VTPTSYRAYTVEQTESRRTIDGEKKNVIHEVENVAFEGDIVDGVIEFDAGDTHITRVAFYCGSGDETVAFSEVSVNQSGLVHVELIQK
jgi:hypothetical protein